jgi:hypothetical protein
MVPAARSDIYVALLGVALGAIVLGCLFLVLVLNRYGFEVKPSISARTAVPAPGAALAGVEKNRADLPTVRL